MSIRKDKRLSVELTRTASDRLAAVAEEHGMSHLALLAHLVAWFAEQGPGTQSAVLGHYHPEIGKEDLTRLLERAARKGRGSVEG